VAVPLLVLLEGLLPLAGGSQAGQVNSSLGHFWAPLTTLQFAVQRQQPTTLMVLSQYKTTNHRVQHATHDVEGGLWDHLEQVMLL
jgi:hypothetical protein